MSPTAEARGSGQWNEWLAAIESQSLCMCGQFLHPLQQSTQDCYSTQEAFSEATPRSAGPSRRVAPSEHPVNCRPACTSVEGLSHSRAVQATPISIVTEWQFVTLGGKKGGVVFRQNQPPLPLHEVHWMIKDHMHVLSPSQIKSNQVNQTRRDRRNAIRLGRYHNQQRLATFKREVYRKQGGIRMYTVAANTNTVVGLTKKSHTTTLRRAGVSPLSPSRLRRHHHDHGHCQPPAA